VSRAVRARLLPARPRAPRRPRLNDGWTYRERIGPRAVGQRLDGYMSLRYPHSSLEQWSARIVAGRVRLDGGEVEVGVLLRLGQDLSWERPPWIEPDAPLGLAVLYAAGGVLVVAKPAGLPTMPGGGFLQHTLLHQLRLLHPDASPVHRLGRWTSGAVLCSRTPEVGAGLAAQLAGRSVRKRYRALASGHPARDRFSVDLAIGPVPYAPLGTLHAARVDGRPSSSDVSVLERRAGSSLCDVVIATGRPHQIRIHLAGAGHPLVGDPLYAVGGGPIVGGTALPGDPGYALHSAEVGFAHPETGAWTVVLAPAPELLHPAG
jgi:23S rRNA pseudouridine1911/1915/1917 synthase